MFSHSSTMSTIASLLTRLDIETLKKLCLNLAWYLLADPLFEFVQQLITICTAVVVTFFTVPVPATSAFPFFDSLRTLFFGADPVPRSPFAELVETYIPFNRTTGFSVDDAFSYISSLADHANPAQRAMAETAGLFDVMLLSVSLSLICLAVIGIAVFVTTVVFMGETVSLRREGMRGGLRRLVQQLQLRKRAATYNFVAFLGNDLICKAFLLLANHWLHSKFRNQWGMAMVLVGVGAFLVQDVCKEWLEMHSDWGYKPKHATMVRFMREVDPMGRWNPHQVKNVQECLKRDMLLFDMHYGHHLVAANQAACRAHERERLEYLRMKYAFLLNGRRGGGNRTRPAEEQRANHANPPFVALQTSRADPETE